MPLTVRSYAQAPYSGMRSREKGLAKEPCELRKLTAIHVGPVRECIPL
jgi:hypothetical protein